MTLFKFLAAIFLIALMSLQGAYAADDPPKEKQESGRFFSDMTGAVKTFAAKANNNMAGALASAGYEIANKTTDVALSIGGALALVYLFYEITQFLSGKQRSMLQILFDIGIPCTMAVLLIKNFSTYMKSFEELLNIFRGIAGPNVIQSMMDMYGGVFGNIGVAIHNTFDRLTDFAAAIEGPFSYLVSWLDALITFIFILIILGLLLSGIAEVLGLLLLGPFLFAIGIAFGPILIAGIVTPWTRDYFTKWLQFIVISAGLTGVINVIFKLCEELLKFMAIDSYGSSEPTAVAMVIVCVLLLTINNMIGQAPSIASALFPGHIGASKSASGALKQAMKTPANAKETAKNTAQKYGNAKAATAEFGKNVATKAAGMKAAAAAGMAKAKGASGPTP